MRWPLDSCWPKETYWRIHFVGGVRGEPPTLPGFQNFLTVIQSLLLPSESVLSSESSWSVGSPTHCRP